MPKTSPKDIAYQQAVKDAINLRAVGVWYSEIIEKVLKADGETPFWKNIQACQKAVAHALAADLNNTVEAGRNEIVARKERQLFKLMDKFEKNGSVIVSREINRVDDQIAKLKGYYAPTKIAETDKDGKDKPAKIIVEYVELNHAQNSETSPKPNSDSE